MRRKYIGSRYVPVFADPIEWDSTREYEPLTMVVHDNSTYTSKQYVPTGIDITNTTYWAMTFGFPAGMEQLRREMDALEDKMDLIEEDIGQAVSDYLHESGLGLSFAVTDGDLRITLE